MKNFKNENKGFTLAELLIVVAIIAVLAAISIPILSARLETSREATDIANIRAAYAAAQTAALTGTYGTDAAAIAADTTYYYDTIAGDITTTAPGNWFQGTTKGENAEVKLPGSIVYNRKKAYKTLTITFTGDNGAYTAAFTLGE